LVSRSPGPPAPLTPPEGTPQSASSYEKASGPERFARGLRLRGTEAIEWMNLGRVFLIEGVALNVHPEGGLVVWEGGRWKGWGRRRPCA
jgi:hypothetical protein